MTIRTYLLLMGVRTIMLMVAMGVTVASSTTTAAQSVRFAPRSVPVERQRPTPTPDRLAPPPTVASPAQADVGAQVYWLNCQPCHGDRGQGLTDEWFVAEFAAAMWGLDAAQLQRISAVEHMPDDFRL